jgi:hypothetical protein
LAAILWVVAGLFVGSDRLTIGGFTPLYVGEVIAVYAFALSWLFKGWDLMTAVFRGWVPRAKPLAGAGAGV